VGFYFFGRSTHIIQPTAGNIYAIKKHECKLQNPSFLCILSQVNMKESESEAPQILNLGMKRW